MRVLKLSGTPRERGRQHGEHFKNDIHALSEIRGDLLKKYLKRHASHEMTDLLEKGLRALQRTPETSALYEEFCGISEASGLNPHALLILNNYTDLRDFEKTDEGCSAFAVSTGHGVLAGQTWDMHASARDFMISLQIQADKNPAQEVLTVAGCLGLAGVNAKGVTVLINNLHCDEANANGLMWPALVRLLLNSESLSQAEVTLAQNPPTSGRNFLVASPQGFVDIEVTGHRQSLVKRNDGTPGFVFHTNHYVGPLQETEVMRLQSKTTHPRYAALEKTFSKLDLTEATAKSLTQTLFVEGDCAKTICMPPGTGLLAADSATCGGIMADLSHAQKIQGYVYAGLYTEGDRSPFQF